MFNDVLGNKLYALLCSCHRFQRRVLLGGGGYGQPGRGAAAVPAHILDQPLNVLHETLPAKSSRLLRIIFFELKAIRYLA